MIEKININTLVNHVVFTIDSILDNKDYPQELLDYLYLITIGMILKYGDEFINDIYAVMTCTKFNISSTLYNETKYYINPARNNYRTKWLDLAHDFPTINIKNELLFKKIDNSFVKTLEYLTYELNFILFNKNKRYSLTDLIRIRYDYYKNGLVDEKSNYTIDKVFNLLSVEDIIKNILELRDENITNKKIVSCLNKLNNVDLTTYKVEGLDILVNLFRPLYKFDETKKLIKDNILLSNNIIEKEFDKVLGKNTYKNICKKLNDLEVKFNNSIDNLNTNYYILSIEYIDIKNNFINKYINKKYLETEI